MSLVEGVRLAKKIGFDTYDIFRDPREMTAKDRREFRKVLQETGMPVVAITTPAVSVIDINPTIRRLTINWVKEQLDLAYDYDASKMLFVVGEYIWEKEVIKPETQWGWAVEGVREIADHAASLGMELAIELEPFPKSLINSIDNMLRFLKDVNHKAVKANADVSHLHLIRLPPQELKKLQGQVSHVHFSDNNGKVHGDLPPGKGNAPLKQYLAVLKEMGFNGSVTIELEFCPEPHKIVEWVTEAYSVTAAMMKELGIRS